MQPPSYIPFAEVEARLEALAQTSPDGVVAFDADGTLWQDDVGEIAFRAICSAQAVKESVRAPLESLAREVGLQTRPDASPSDLALALDQLFIAGELDERRACEMQAWIYGGYEAKQLQKLIQDALTQANHESAVYDPMSALLKRAQQLGLKVIVVSASPQPVLEVALCNYPLPLDAISGGKLLRVEGSYLPQLASPLPYADEKVRAAEALLGERPLLMAFGDSCFDLAMLRSARQGVTIGEKPSLLRALTADDNFLHLQSPTPRALARSTNVDG